MFFVCAYVFYSVIDGLSDRKAKEKLSTEKENASTERKLEGTYEPTSIFRPSLDSAVSIFRKSEFVKF